MPEPMIRLGEDGASAPVLKYDVPEPTSYSGRHVVELDFGRDVWTDAARRVPPAPPTTGGGSRPIVVRPEIVLSPGVIAMARPGGAIARTVDSAATPSPATAAAVTAPESGGVAGTGLSEVQARVVIPVVRGAETRNVAAMLNQGYHLATYRDLGGNIAARVVPDPPAAARPRLLLVEIYRLSSFLGDYGAGRVIKTFTLLPGEKTKISVKTYTKTVTDAKSASSILDSFTQESAEEFEDQLSSEQSDKQNSTENFEYHAEAEASASWGWGSAKVSGGVKGGTTSAREEFSKNTKNATQKHSAKASAKRDVQVNTSYEVKSETGEETSVERAIENVNLSRVLNFVFRQMNQQFITVLHLTDVRVAFFNGHKEFAREVALPQLQSLLDEVVKPADQGFVRDAIVAQVEEIRDHRGVPAGFVETVDLGDGAPYLRVKRDLISRHTDTLSGRTVEFFGIPTAVDSQVMRTEGIIVEALLGEASSLDGYAEELQRLEVRKRQAEVQKLEAEAARAALINQLALDAGNDGAKVLAELTCPCGPKPAPAPAPAPTPTPPPA